MVMTVIGDRGAIRRGAIVSSRAQAYSVTFGSFKPALEFCPFCFGFLDDLTSPTAFVRLTRVNEEERVTNDERDESSPDEDWNDDAGNGRVEKGSHKEQG